MEKAILQKIENAAIRYKFSDNCTAKERLQILIESKGMVFENLCNIFGLSDKEIDFIYNM